MSYDTIGMIRRGWQDGVATVAPHVPGLGDLLEQRLAEAIRLGRLDEAGLLSIVDAATQLAADLGAVEIAPALSKRLRRHVYEYLLSLDALGGSAENAAFGQAATPDHHQPVSGTEEATGMGEMEFAEVGSSVPDSNGGGVHRFPPVHYVAEPARPGPEPTYPASEDGYAEAETVYPATGPSYPLPDSPHPLPGSTPPLVDSTYPPRGETTVRQEAEEGSGSPPPQFSFHIGDPDDVLTSRAAHQEPGGAASAAGPSSSLEAGAIETPTGGRVPARRHASFSDPSSWPKPVTPTLRGTRDPLAEGLREELLSPDDLPASAATDGTRFQDVGPWPPTPAADPPHRSGPADLARWSSPWPSPEAPATGPREAAITGASPAPVGADFQPANGPAHHEAREEWRDAAEGRLPTSPPTGLGVPPPQIAPSWSGRQQEAGELHMAPPANAGAPSPPTNNVPDRDLVALRASVDGRLRKKRCDDVAAMLQQAAQELGGQAVAELALDAGDRCRSLGKKNAALNCYLAASRADPVYEPPLARLADICIDDQDIDLAVSYLERIARLTRLRGDNPGALRIYRKIATIAPYRDDVLEMLMRAQTTGMMDP